MNYKAIELNGVNTLGKVKLNEPVKSETVNQDYYALRENVIDILNTLTTKELEDVISGIKKDVLRVSRRMPTSMAMFLQVCEAVRLWKEKN